MDTAARVAGYVLNVVTWTLLLGFATYGAIHAIS